MTQHIEEQLATHTERVVVIKCDGPGCLNFYVQPYVTAAPPAGWRSQRVSDGTEASLQYDSQDFCSIECHVMRLLADLREQNVVIYALTRSGDRVRIGVDAGLVFDYERTKTPESAKV